MGTGDDVVLVKDEPHANWGSGVCPVSEECHNAVLQGFRRPVRWN
jgi:hypothetical protein